LEGKVGRVGRVPDSADVARERMAGRGVREKWEKREKGMRRFDDVSCSLSWDVNRSGAGTSLAGAAVSGSSGAGIKTSGCEESVGFQVEYFGSGSCTSLRRRSFPSGIRLAKTTRMLLYR